MVRLIFLCIILVFVFACTFPEQHKENIEVRLDQGNARVLGMSDEEFLQHAKQNDPDFRKKIEDYDKHAAREEQIKKELEMKDEELRELVRAEALKRSQEQQKLQDEIEEVDIEEEYDEEEEE